MMASWNLKQKHSPSYSPQGIGSQLFWEEMCSTFFSIGVMKHSDSKQLKDCGVQSIGEDSQRIVLLIEQEPEAETIEKS